MWLCVFVLISRISNYVPDTEPAPATKNNHNRVVPEHHMIAISDTDLETRMLRSRRTVIIQSKILLVIKREEDGNKQRRKILLLFVRY